MKNKIGVMIILLLGLSCVAQALPQVAIVLDDFGLTYPKNPTDEQWMALAGTMTFAVMPQSPRTKQAAQLTLAAGKELIIHFPFDPFQTYDLNKDTVTASDVKKATTLLEKAIKEIPGAVGLNNHRSYKATMNQPLMNEFMKHLKPKGLYFVDSKVSNRSVAGLEARAAGIPTTTNYIFLDTAEIHTQEFCTRMLARAVAHARTQGSAVAIGHHYFHGTFDCLRTEMPKYEKEGIEFVKLSSLVH